MKRRLLIAAAMAACALTPALAGCGGNGRGDALKDVSASSRANDKPAIGDPPQPKQQKSLLGASGVTASAGDDESVAPTGKLIADSGFRPEIDGFGFENYGNDVGPENLTRAEVQSLFGDQVCIGGNGDRCRLIPPAQRWLENENARMNGGHCMGFSVAALRMFERKLKASDFGATPTSALKIQGNVRLQSSIAEHWTYQDLPLIREKIVQGTPTRILEQLVDALNSGREDYTLGILMADGSGGHAITPFAVEDKGDNTYAILVYDNNFPGITRAVTVDVDADSWRYVGGTNPKNLGEVYEGDADTRSMALLPTSPGEEVQPCPFCRGTSAGPSRDLGSVLPKDERYSEITLGGAVANHPHLVLTDDKGRQTGIVGGDLKREIPGVEVAETFSVRNWEASPEPKYQVPAGQDIAMTLDGSSLKRTAKAKVDLVGNGLVIAIEEIEIAPGQRDNVFVDGGGNGLYYESNGKGEATPELYAGVEDGVTAYTFAATAAGLKRGSTIGLLVDRKSGTVLLDAEGSKGSLNGRGFFALVVGKSTARRTLTWGTGDLELSGKRKEGAYFNYKDVPAAGAPLELEVGPENGPFKTVKAGYEP